jgi:hypothetical protein
MYKTINPLYVTIILLLIVYSFIIPLSLSNIVNFNRDHYIGISKNAFTIRDAISYVIKKLRLNPRDPRIMYGLYYSGHVLKIKASMLKSIIGLNPRNIVFAYFNGFEWKILPFRIYDRVIRSNLTTIYVMPKKISPNTTIELKLPSHIPLIVNPWSKIPEFARAAKALQLTLKNNNGVFLGAIYLFIDGSVPYSTADIQSITTIDYANINEYFEASEPPILINYMYKAGLNGEYALAILKQIINKPLILGKDISYSINWLPPVMDGGGGGTENPYNYNLIDLRPQPLRSMIQNDYILDYSKPSYDFEIYTIDPLVNDISWKTIRLTIIIGLKNPMDITRTLYVKIYSNDFSYQDSFIIYGNKKNILSTQYTPSSYGITDKTIHVKIYLDTITDNEKWYFRIMPMITIKWNYDNLEDSRAKPIYLFIPGEVNKLVYTFSSDHKTGIHMLFIPPLQELSIPYPESATTIKIHVESGNLNNVVYPLYVTIDFGGVSRCTAEIDQPNTPSICELVLSREDIISLSSQYKPIPVTIEVSTMGNINTVESTEIDLWVENGDQGVLMSRTMYIYYTSNDDKILFSSTRSEDDNVWHYGCYFIKGRVVMLMAYQQSYIYMKGLELLVSRLMESKNGPYNELDYKITIDARSPNNGFISYEDGSYDQIMNMKLNKAVLTIQFPDTEGIAPDAVCVPLKFDLSGSVPPLPEAPAPIAVVLSHLPYIGLFYEGYTIVSWSYNLLAESTASDISISIDHQNNKIVIVWTNGYFSDNEFAGEIRIVGIYVYSESGSITISLHLEYDTTSKDIVFSIPQ